MQRDGEWRKRRAARGWPRSLLLPHSSWHSLCSTGACQARLYVIKRRILLHHWNLLTLARRVGQRLNEPLHKLVFHGVSVISRVEKTLAFIYGPTWVGHKHFHYDMIFLFQTRLMPNTGKLWCNTRAGRILSKALVKKRKRQVKDPAATQKTRRKKQKNAPTCMGCDDAYPYEYIGTYH